MDVSNSEPIDISKEMAALCEKLGMVPSYVAWIHFEPDKVAACIYLGTEGRYEGSPHVDEDGDVVTEVLRFEVRA